MKILVVDDEDDVCESTQKMLAKCGYFVSTCDCAEDAKAFLLSGDYKLLITDVKMDGEDGIRLALFAKRKCPGIKIIVITGFATNRMLRYVKAAGIDHFLSKPCSLKTLKVLVDDCLKGLQDD